MVKLWLWLLPVGKSFPQFALDAVEVADLPEHSAESITRDKSCSADRAAVPRLPATFPVMTDLHLMTKEQFRAALNLSSTRMVDELVRKWKISAIGLGHRTVRFNLAKVVAALERLELKAVGDK